MEELSGIVSVKTDKNTMMIFTLAKVRRETLEEVETIIQTYLRKAKEYDITSQDLIDLRDEVKALPREQAIH